jgi:hypothetical protein
VGCSYPVPSVAKFVFLSFSFSNLQKKTNFKHLSMFEKEGLLFMLGRAEDQPEASALQCT